jgi:hypothetical protein
MSFDDRPANRQPHSYSAGFRGVESLENALERFRIDTRPGIAHCHEDAICLALFGANRQRAWPLLGGAHCFDRIQNQVQDDLLQLNTVPPTESAPSVRWVSTETPFFAISVRANTITSLIASLRSKRRFCGGAFLIWSRIRSMMSPARSASFTIQSSASVASPSSGGCLSKKFRAALALLRAAAIGCLTS